MTDPRYENSEQMRAHIERRTGIAFTKNAASNWRYTGKGPRWHKISGKIIYRESDVDQWIDEQLNRTITYSSGPKA